MTRRPFAVASRDGLALGAVTLLSLCLAPCAPPPAVAPEARPAPPPGFLATEYRQLAAHGRPVFRIEPARSLVTLAVHRAGSLARIGHDPVIAAHDVQGYVAPDDGYADLYLRLDALSVEEPELRAEAKLDTHPPPEDIAGTRRNMLNGLEAACYPFAQVHIGATPLGRRRRGAARGFRFVARGDPKLPRRCIWFAPATNSPRAET